MTNEEIKADIVAACREFKRSGGELISGSFGDGRGCGCPLTAVAISNQDDSFFDHLQGYLKISSVTAFARYRYGWTWWGPISFYRGFDRASEQDMSGEEIDADVFDLGRAVRAEVLP